MKYTYIWILLLLAVFTVTGCSTIQKIAEFNLEHLDVEKQVAEKEYIRLPESSYVKDTIELSMDNVKTLNPLDGVPYNVDQGLKIVYEGLFSINEQNTLDPVLVADYEKISENAYRLNLKEDVIFHNDEAFTATDVLFSYEYIKAHPQSGYSYVNAYVDTMYIESDRSIVVEFLKKDRYNLFALTFPILSRAYVESEEYDKTFPIGTGPYKCQRFQNMLECILEKNLNYHGTLAQTDKIRFTLVRSFSEEYNMFTSKRIDLIAPILTEWTNYSDDQRIVKKEYLSPYYYYIGFNHMNPYFQEVKVRRYFSSLIDYSHINRTIFLNHLFFTPLPILLESDIQGQMNIYNVFQQEKMVRPLDEYENTIRFIYLEDDNTQVDIIKSIQESTDSVQENIEFVGLNRADYNNALANKDFDMYLNTYQASIVPSLNQFLGSDGIYNYGSYTNQNIDGLLSSYRQVETDEQYIKQLNTLSQWVMENVPIIPIGFLENGMFIHNKVEGTIAPNYFYLYKNIQDIKITDHTEE